MVRNDMERNGRKGGDQIETERITVAIRHQHLITIYAVYAIAFGHIYGCHHLHQYLITIYAVYAITFGRLYGFHHLHQLHLLSLGLSLSFDIQCVIEERTR